jgi:hypothetical protein
MENWELDNEWQAREGGAKREHDGINYEFLLYRNMKFI